MPCAKARKKQSGSVSFKLETRRFIRSVAFEVGIAVEAFFVGAQEVAGFFEAHLSGAQGDFGGAAHSVEEAFARIHDRAQHLVDGIAGTDVVEEVTVFGDGDLNGVCVAEEVVHVAEDLLIGADEEEADEIGLTVGHRVQLQDIFDVALVDEVLDFAV